MSDEWTDHLGHDGTIHPTTSAGCRFGSALRDDVCHPRRVESHHEQRWTTHEGSDHVIAYWCSCGSYDPDHLGDDQTTPATDACLPDRPREKETSCE